jgi:hypothetical protein
MHKHRYREHIRMHTYAYICTHAHMHTHTCRHMHTYAHRCTHAHIRMQTYAHICTHAHIHMHTYAHICTLLPYQVFCSVFLPSPSFLLSPRMSKDSPGDVQEVSDVSDLSDDGFQDCEDADLSEDASSDHGPGDQIQETIVQDWLNIVQDASRLKAMKAQALKQKAQALKQAKHWQASCQKERAKHMKLKKDYEELMKENNEYKVLHQKLGAWMSLGQSHFTKTSEEFHQNEVSPHYDEPGKALTDLQSPMPTPPSTPPPMYLLRQFKSKPKARKGLCKKDGSPNTSFNRASVGGKMGKQAHPIGARHVQRPPPIGKGPM